MCNSEVLEINLFLGWGTLWGLLVLWNLVFLLWEPPAAFFIIKNIMKQETNQSKK